MTSETGVNSDETGGPLSASARRRLRVLSVIPGEPEGSVMIFARRQSASISALGLTVRDFHLADRTSPGRWWQELRRLRQEVCAFDPDLVHAHYGTVTALSAALTKGRRPLVITFRGSDLNPTAAVSGFRSVAGRVISQFSALSAAAVICVCDGSGVRSGGDLTGPRHPHGGGSPPISAPRQKRGAAGTRLTSRESGGCVQLRFRSVGKTARTRRSNDSACPQVTAGNSVRRHARGLAAG